MSGIFPLSVVWISPRRWLAGVLLVLLSGCAAINPEQYSLLTPPTPSAVAVPVAGRMSLRIDSDPVQSHPLSFSGWLEPQSGQIDWFAVTGQTVAQVWWSPLGASIRSPTQPTQHFSSLSQLSRQLTGTDLPAPAFSDWMRGVLTPVEGWNIEMTSNQPLRIQAQRSQPAPAIRLILLLESEP